MKSVFMLTTFTFISILVFAQKKSRVTVIFGEYYSKDTVAVVYNKDTLFQSIIGDQYYGKKAAEVSFVRTRDSKRVRDFLWVFVNNMKIAVKLNDFKKFRNIVVDYVPNSSDVNDRTLVISAEP